MSGPNKNYDPVEVTPLHADEVERTRDEALDAFAKAADLGALQEAKAAHLGERSPVALANREIGALPPQARKEAGQRIGAARKVINEAYAGRLAVLEAEHEERMLATEQVDVTLPWHTPELGARHPLSLISEQVADVFTALGWDVAEGPEIEAEWLNFDALNFQPDHPARQMQDTFFVEPVGSGKVLRTHTSPVQARSMLTRKPPIYVICPGRVFRTDELDATHTPVFYQVEGLVVDEGHHARAPEGHPRPLRRVDVRRGPGGAAAAELLPVHRAVGRGRPEVLRLPRRVGGQPGPPVPDLWQRGLDRVGRLRRGEPARTAAPPASTPTGTPVSRSGWAWSGP